MPAKFKIGEIVLLPGNDSSKEKILKRSMYWEEGKRHWIYKLKGLYDWWSEDSIFKTRKPKSINSRVNR